MTNRRATTPRSSRLDPDAGPDAGPVAGPDADASALAVHREHCRLACGRGHSWRSLAEAAHAALRPRFVTTVAAQVALIALALGIAWLAG